MKLSVCMATFNHKRFIAQTIESVLMQRTDFDFELVIGEDGSTDGTAEICRAYAQKYPGRIRLLAHPKNVGGNLNIRGIYMAARGEFLAILEGDDYWTDPYKLQRQVESLEANRDCAVSFHNVRVEWKDSSREPYLFCTPTQKARLKLDDMLMRNYMATGSVVVRAGIEKSLPEWFLTLPACDWAFNILNVQRGDALYLNEVMGVYRRHLGGMSNDRVTMNESKVQMFHHLAQLLAPRYLPIIQSRIAFFSDLLAFEKLRALNNSPGLLKDAASVRALANLCGEYSRIPEFALLQQTLSRGSASVAEIRFRIAMGVAAGFRIQYHYDEMKGIIREALQWPGLGADVKAEMLMEAAHRMADQGKIAEAKHLAVLLDEVPSVSGQHHAVIDLLQTCLGMKAPSRSQISSAAAP